jgi:transposase
MIIVQGEVYLEEWHIAILKNEPESVRKRYHAIARTLVGDIVRITRQEAADMIDRSRRQLQRIVKRFREEGIKGLRFKSKKPYNILNKTPIEIEKRIIKVRKATGFGPEQLANIVNESLNVKDKVVVEQQQISKTTAYNILARYSLVDAEKKMVKEYKSFERDKPDELVQADLTRFNGLPILTMEDDHSRKFWAARLENETDDTVVDSMKHLHDQKYDSLLTDNGSQFSRRNSVMKKYCDQYLTGTHIWTSIHHPQTMGKLSNAQRGLKRFLIHRLRRSTDHEDIDRCISVYVDWYNNGKKISTTKCYPEERYSGQRDSGWYTRFVKALKLEHILPVPVAMGG